MKTLTPEMKDYLTRGMREELEKDTQENPNESVRWHTGMFHETTNTVRQWMECVERGDEEDADFHFTTLEGAFVWWKNYFDYYPEYAREYELQKDAEMFQRMREEREQRERDALAAFEDM